MLCKKCRAEITDNAKFCGYCGETVATAPIVNEPQKVESDVNNSVSEPVINENELGKTVVVEPITQEIENSVSEPVVNQNTPVPPMTGTPNNKKSKTPILIIGGIILAVLAAVLLIFAFTNSSSNSVEVLKKSLANLEKDYDSITVEAKLSASASGTTLDFSALVKTQKISDKKANIQIKVNPSLLSKEMNVYATADEKEVNMYLESTLIDMLGTTSSINSSWVKHTLKLDEMMEEAKIDEKLSDLKLEDVIDESHFVYIDKVDKLNHYELIIDQELVDKIAELSGEKLDETEKLEEVIKIDFYISNSNEITKIELDMSEYLDETVGVSSMVLSLEIKDINKTEVQIPSEALNTTTNLENYMMDNAISYENDFDSNFDTDFDTENDANWGF